MRYRYRYSVFIAMLMWYSQTFQGPYAHIDMMWFLNSLPLQRAREAKIIQGLRQEDYGLAIDYTVIYRDEPSQEDKGKQ